MASCIELSTRSTVGYNINVKNSSSGRGRISVHIILYIVWGKGRHIDGFYAQGFECKKFHSKSSLFSSRLYNVDQPRFRNLFCRVAQPLKGRQLYLV